MQTIIHGPQFHNILEDNVIIPSGAVMTLKKAKQDASGKWQDIQVRVTTSELSATRTRLRQDVHVEEI